MKISVVGIGYVGLVAAGCLADGGNHVICVDKDKKKIAGLKRGEIPIYEPGLAEIVAYNESAGRLIFTTDLKEAVDNSKVIFLAVGTPSSADGSADISSLLEVAGDIAGLMKEYRIIVTKSTVPVGTHKVVCELIKSKTACAFDYVSNPEFLKEGAAVEDFMKPDRVIMGTENRQVQEVMKQLYGPFMRKSSRLLFMDAASAEMTKYAANTMLAARISFMNEISRLCDKCGADVEKVRAGIGSDSRIGNAFLFPGIGYGGSCFPKDVRALIHMGDENGCEMSIAKAVQGANIAQQGYFVGQIGDYFGGKSGVVLAVWGLTFKARTDDIRESPAISCVGRLVEMGIKIRAYDPEASTAAVSELFGGMVEMGQDAYGVLEGADGLVVCTDWQEFRGADFDMMLQKLRGHVIFDGRNLYDRDYVRGLGFDYYGIGRNR